MDKDLDRLREKNPDSVSSESRIKEVLRSLQQIEREIQKLAAKKKKPTSS